MYYTAYHKSVLSLILSLLHYIGQRVYTCANLPEVVILRRKGQLQPQGVQGELQYLLHAVVVLGLDQLQVVIAY